MPQIRNNQVPAGVQSNANGGGFAPRPARTAPTITLAPNAPTEIAYVRFNNPTPEVPNGDPIGYTYRAENVTGSQLVENLIREGRLSPGARGMRVEDALDQLAAIEDVNRRSQVSFDSDRFPKPVEQDQLDCSDEWAGDYAPEHVSDRGEFPECVRCGREMPAEVSYDEDEEYEDVEEPRRPDPVYDTSHIDRDALRLRIAQMKSAGSHAAPADIDKATITWAAAWVADNIPGATELVFGYDEDGDDKGMELLHVNSVHGRVRLDGDEFAELDEVAATVDSYDAGFPVDLVGLDACVSIQEALDAARL